MAILVALNHVTHYRYDRLVTLSPQVVRLRPAPHTPTAIRSYSLRVLPATWLTDHSMMNSFQFIRHRRFH